MADSPQPKSEPEPHDRRLIPGGSFEAAEMHVGMEGSDRDVLISGGQANFDYAGSPEKPGKRPPGPE